MITQPWLSVYETDRRFGDSLIGYVERKLVVERDGRTPYRCGIYGQTDREREESRQTALLLAWELMR